MTFLRLEDGVNVIRHDDEVAHPGAVAVKVEKGFMNEGGVCGIAQNATTVAEVEFVVEELGGCALELLPLLFWNAAIEVKIGLWTRLLPCRFNAVSSKPIAMLPIPLIEDALGDGICLSESDKVCGAGLTPVRQIAVVDAQLAALIEAAKDRRV